MEREEFDKMMGEDVSEAITIKTVDLATRAESLYRNVSGMVGPDMGKGYSNGGAVYNLCSYVGLDWDVIEAMCQKISMGTIHSTHHVIEKLKESNDPDDKLVLKDVLEDTASLILQNVAYHNFWIGYMMRDVAEDKREVLPAFDETAPLEINLDMAMQAGLTSVLTVLQKHIDGEVEDDEVVPELGLSLAQIFEIGEKMSGARGFMDTLPKNPEQRWSVDAMIAMTGIIIGRSMAVTGQ